jgi:hypothetical protein
MKCESPDLSQPYGAPRPVTGDIFTFFTLLDIGEWLVSPLGRFIRGESVSVVEKRQQNLQDLSAYLSRKPRKLTGKLLRAVTRDYTVLAG